MQNGLKRMRTGDPPSLTNSNISDTIQDFPLTNTTNAPSSGGSGRSSAGGGSGGLTGTGNRQTREPASSQPQQKQDMKPQEHPLYSRGVCTWAGCETSCDTFSAFISHLNKDHVLDERSTAQTRVQVHNFNVYHFIYTFLVSLNVLGVISKL